MNVKTKACLWTSLEDGAASVKAEHIHRWGRAELGTIWDNRKIQVLTNFGGTGNTGELWMLYMD